MTGHSIGDFIQYSRKQPLKRGIGLGNKLLKQFIEFAKACKYKNAYLWTTNELDTAHHLYQKIGFTLTEEKPSTEFGKS